MVAIKLDATVSADHKLIVELPDDVPVGAVKLTIEPQGNAERPPLTRERAREILLAAGLLVTTIHAPEGTVPLTDEEIMQLTRLPPGSPSSLDLINEDRGEY